MGREWSRPLGRGFLLSVRVACSPNEGAIGIYLPPSHLEASSLSPFPLLTSRTQYCNTHQRQNFAFQNYRLAILDLSHQPISDKMKFTLALVAAGLVAAQDFSGVPQCAVRRHPSHAV